MVAKAARRAISSLRVRLLQDSGFPTVTSRWNGKERRVPIILVPSLILLRVPGPPLTLLKMPHSDQGPLHGGGPNLLGVHGLDPTSGLDLGAVCT